MKRINKKGFTLIELLAVIVILGVIMLVAVPAVTGYISNTRKEAYLEVAREVTRSISQQVSNGDYILTDIDSIYYFDYHNAHMDPKPVSPYGGEFKQAYVIVTLNEDYSPNYYWTSLDEKGYYIEARKPVDDLTVKDVKYTTLSSISNSAYVENKDGLIQIDASGVEHSGADAENITSLEEANKCFELEMLEDGTYSIVDFYADKEICYENKDANNYRSVNVPSLIDGKQVTKIGDSAFRNKNITEVILYKGITEVGYQAFMDNTSLTSIKMSSTVISIDDYAFYGCGIQKLILSEGLQYIKQYAFAYNKIDYIYFPTTLLSIGQYAFYHNNLTEILFNSPMDKLGTGAFAGNKLDDSLKFIYKRNADGSYDRTHIIGYAGSETSIVIPEGIKTIGQGSFASLNLTSVSLPSTLTKIEGTAFYSNQLTSVTFPEGLTSIGGSAFRNNKLTSITIPNSVTSIGGGAFKYNCVTSINGLNSSIVYAKKSDGSWDYSKIVSGANGNCGLNSIVIPAVGPNNTKLKNIASSAFSEFSYSSITLPELSQCDHLTIATNAFYHNRLRDAEFIYKISNGVEDKSTLDSYAGNPLDENGIIRIPESKDGVTLTTINASFNWKKFKTIVIPSGVTTFNGSIAKGTSNNKNFDTIVNKTGRAFDWATITASVYQKGETFVTGELRHQSGNITVVATEP